MSNLYDQVEELINSTAQMTHKASTAINPTMSDNDCEEIAQSLEMLASALRRIPRIRKMLNEN